MHLNPDCLSSASEKIIVNGVCYGLVREVVRNVGWPSKRVIKYQAKMDLPDLVAFRSFFGDGFHEADTKTNAVLAAFEDFVRSDALPLDEFTRIGLELFDDDAPIVDVLAELETAETAS